jgi:hypothetical protein
MRVPFSFSNRPQILPALSRQRRFSCSPRVILVIGITVLSGCAASFSPRPVAEVPFKARAQTQVQDGLTVTVAVPTAEEAEAIYGLDLAYKGMQAV